MAQGLITREIKQSQMWNWHGCHTNTKRTASYTEIGKPAGTQSYTGYTTCTPTDCYSKPLRYMEEKRPPQIQTPTTTWQLLDSLLRVFVQVWVFRLIFPMSKVPNRMRSPFDDSSISKFLRVSFNRTVQSANQKLFRRREINAVQKENNAVEIFLKRLCFLFWDPVTSRVISALTTGLACLNCINQRLQQNITRSVSCVETHGRITGGIT